LRAFRAEFPRVGVCLFEMERAEQLVALREGRIHLGLFPCLGEPLEPSLDALLVWSCPMVAVLPPGHFLTKKDKVRTRSLDIQALAGETLIVLSSEGSPGYMERLEHICATADFHPAFVRPVDGSENVLGMVAAGYGVAILPEVLVAALHPSCMTKPLRAPVAPLELKLLWRREAPTGVIENFLAVAKLRAQKATSP
ncbi:MAG: LysR family substrate-binding domain-containing protein, partial [Rhodospirillales bacterium]|nr:LysR family substrate-binding domain-containing protein [Acetobacter sp.]